MMVLLLSINIILGMLVLITLFNAFTAPFLKKAPSLAKTPKVSVLVPARNEAHKIRKCLNSLMAQDYPNMEIRVLDDQSTDDTANILYRIKQENPHAKLHIISGSGPEPGWTGKNYACHQLAQKAKGDILIFTDADNWYDTGAVSATVAWMDKYKLDVLSAFPQQITHTLAEKLVVPIMDLFVYSMLPLWLTLKCQQPSVAAANGQWIAFKRDTYQQVDGHKSVKGELVEDTVLVRLAKKMRHRTLTLSGKGAVYGRMYSGWQQVFEGFSKNIFGLWGYHLPGFILFLLALLMVFVTPFILIFFKATPLVLTAVLANLLLRAILVRFGHPVQTILLHPLGMIMVLVIGIHSVCCYFRGSVTWKERVIAFQK